MLVKRIYAHWLKDVGEKFLVFKAFSNLFIVYRYVLIVSINLNLASIRRDNLVHQSLHRYYLVFQVWVFSSYLMDNKCVLRVQIYRQAFHFQDLGYFSARFTAIMEDYIAFSIDCFEVKLAEQDAKSCLSDLVSSRRVCSVRDVF